MGYADFRETNSSRAFSLALRGAAAGERGRGHAEGRNCSWGELSVISALPQEIVARAVPFRLSAGDSLLNP
jgi:hypothetical protein